LENSSAENLHGPQGRPYLDLTLLTNTYEWEDRKDQFPPMLAASLENLPHLRSFALAGLYQHVDFPPSDRLADLQRFACYSYGTPLSKWTSIAPQFRQLKHLELRFFQDIFEHQANESLADLLLALEPCKDTLEYFLFDWFRDTDWLLSPQMGSLARFSRLKTLIISQNLLVRSGVVHNGREYPPWEYWKEERPPLRISARLPPSLQTLYIFVSDELELSASSPVWWDLADDLHLLPRLKYIYYSRGKRDRHEYYAGIHDEGEQQRPLGNLEGERLIKHFAERGVYLRGD
jgi:hypothetical protein